MADPLSFSRYQVPDPVVNRVLQDMYDKLAQVSAALSALQQKSGTPGSPTPVPIMTTGQNQTPWLSNIDSQGFHITPPDWTDDAPKNGWSNYGSPYPNAGSSVDATQEVSLRGAIVGGTATDGTTLITIPVAHRPQHDQVVDINIFNGTTNLFAVVRIQAATGNVDLFGGPTATIVHLECSFKLYS